MKKIMLSLAVLAAGTQGFAEADGPEKPLKVLMIGNSFSICNLRQMPQVAASMGFKLDLASLYIGGCSLERHWNNVVTASTNVAFKPYRFDRTTDGTKVVEKGRANIPDALALDKWDVVTIQQASHFSWQPETYHPFGDGLIAKIRELAPQAEIVVQETWSYPPWDKRLKKFGFDQSEMYARLHGAYAAFAAKYGLDVIPVGTAAELVPNRNSLFTKPDFHFNREGEYLQGLAFTAKLFGVDVRMCPYRPSWMKAARADEIKSAVMDAVAVAGQSQREMSIPVGDACVGFSFTTGTWQKSKKPRNGGVVGSPRTFVPAGTVTHWQMKSLSVTTNGNEVTATWKGHPKCGDGFTVTAKVTLLPDGGFEYTSFDYTGNKGNRHIQRISFPEVTVPRTDKTAIFRPNTVGEVYRPDWTAARRGKDVSFSGANWLTFGCIAALNDGGTSHFLDHRGEARLHTVSLAVTQGTAPGTLVLRNVYVPPMSDELKASGSLPYTGVYAPYCGGWYEAAKMHRSWLETTPCFKAAAARDFSKLREIALWMWTRGGVEVTEPPVLWFMKETGLKVAVDWYWWHGIPYDTSFPYFWPPRDGVDGFRASVKRMRDAGAFLQVYTNGASWDCDDSRWDEDGGLESAILAPNGRLFAKMYNVFTRHRLARVCGEAPKFQGIIRQLERNLRESGLDGVYMDQISCGAHSACYNPRHKHAPGGDAVEKGYRAYVQSVRDDNPGFILSSEATSETYFDLFEAAILLYSSWERCGKGALPQSEPVPAVTVIYRGAEVIFGSFATPGGAPAWDPMWGKKPDGDEVEAVVAKYPDQFAVEFARGIVWGIQPMVHNFTMKDVSNPRLAKDLQFMKDSARFYHENRDFLFDGEILKPAKLNCKTKRVEFLSASCYKRVKDSSTYVQKALPCVFHSEWRANDGRKAAILVNWTREEQPYEIEFEGEKRQGTLPALSWRRFELNSIVQHDTIRPSSLWQAKYKKK